MKRITISLVAGAIMLVMSPGCSPKGDVSPKSRETAPDKVEVEFITGEKTPEELDALGIEWRETDVPSHAGKQEK